MYLHRRNFFASALTAFALNFVSLPSIPDAHAQNYEAMIQQQLQQGEIMSQQMRQMESGIVQRNMQNPEVQARYQQYRASGGTMSFDQFAYQYAATAGFTPDGVGRWNQSERSIQQREQQAVQQYRQNQEQNAEALRQMHQRNADIARQRGNLLNGTTDYIDPSTGERHNLPHTIQPNTGYYDSGTNQGYYNDPQGNYYRGTPNGDWQELEEED